VNEESLPIFLGYKTVALLGEGASSRVYLVEDDSGNKFAVKALREELAGDDSLKGLLESEAKSLLKINHPRVSRFVSFSMDSDPLPHLVTEYVEGKTLKDLVSESPLSGPILLSMSKGLLEGLEAIHQVGIIHKDLKPGNIVFTEEGVKLIDFGISESKDTASSSADDNLAATPGWLSPEQANGKSLTPASDIFNFGMVLAYASSGKHPFGEGTQDALLFRIANGQPSLEAIPNWLKVIVSACLEKEPLGRPTFDQLRAWLNRPGSSAPESISADSTTLVSGTVLSGAARAESSGSDMPGNFALNQAKKPKEPRKRKAKESSGIGWKSVTAIVASVALIAGFFVALSLPGSGMVVVRIEDYAKFRNEVIGEGSVVVEGPGWSEEVSFSGAKEKTLDGEWFSNREISVTFNPSFSQDERYSQTFFPEDYGANFFGTGQQLILEFRLLEERTVFTAKVFNMNGFSPELSVAIEASLEKRIFKLPLPVLWVLRKLLIKQ
jgi:serine/threonine protein kinase